jgi:pyruvate ferredoxin oxidoreductase alpha subunit
MHVIESGNVAAANGVKLSRAQVIAAYPITPQTPLTEKLSEFVDSGKMDAQYIPVESEHSALSVCIAASSAGSRPFTATSANGLLYMNEQLHWAAGARLPIVMCVVNRGVGAPWTVWNDHQDVFSQRDSGWIQLYACDHQQIIDTVIKAYAIAETVSAPVMVCYDGYILSHTYMPFKLPDSEAVDGFLPGFSPECSLDPKNPCNLNTVTLPEVRPDVRGASAPAYMEIRHNLHTDLRDTLEVIESVEERFTSSFGRGGNPFVEPYRCEDADYAAVALGSLSYHLRDVVDELREQGVKIGVMGLRVYRPFPDKAIQKALEAKKGVIVFEKALSYGYQGPVFADIKSALYHWKERPFIHNYILGLGGREIQTRQLRQALETSIREEIAPEQMPQWIGLKI